MNTRAKEGRPQSRKAVAEAKHKPVEAKAVGASTAQPPVSPVVETAKENSARVRKILALAESGDLEHAEALIVDYLSWQGLDSSALSQLAENLYASGRSDLATKAYVTLSALDPAHVGAVGRLADLALKRGDAFTGAKLFRRVLGETKQPEDWMYIGLGNGLEALGDLRGALRCFQKATGTPGMEKRVADLSSRPQTTELPDITDYLDALPAGVKGCVEGTRGISVEGWAFDSTQPKRIVEVEVVDAGHVVASGLANLDGPALHMRSEDLEGRGFRIPLPPELLLDRRDPTLVFRDKETGVELPRLGLPESTDPGIQITIVSCQQDGFTARISVARQHEGPVRLQFWADDVQLPPVVLDDPSGEFQVAFPQEVLDGEEHLFLLFSESEHTLLAHARVTTIDAGLPSLSSYFELSQGAGHVPGSVMALVRRIRQSALFDLAYYTKQSGKRFEGIQDAIVYYLAHPSQWKVQTSLWLDVEFVALLAGSEVGSTISPLEWYVKQPATADAGPNPLFSNADYLSYSGLDPDSKYRGTLFDRWTAELKDAPVNPSALVSIAHVNKRIGSIRHDGVAVRKALVAWLDADKRDPSLLHPVWVVDWLAQNTIRRQIKLQHDWLTAMRVGKVKGLAPASILQRQTEGEDDYYQLVRRYELLCRSAGIDDIESLCPLIDAEEFYRQFPAQPASQERKTRTSSLYRYLASDLGERRESFLLDLDEKFVEAEYPGLIEFCVRERGVGDVNRIWARWLRMLRVPGRYETAIQQKGGDAVAPHDLSMLRSLSAPAESDVRASLVIPTYGRDDLVLRCVLSFASSHSRPDAEILIAEDAVHVDGAWLLGYFLPFAQIYKNEKNLGFLLNCNAAVQRARGQIIVLVNNDVLLHRNALLELMRTFEERADAAVVGGLILNVDGTVQENGGIMWSDASAWNYHRNVALEQEHLRNVREADYVTGAWIGIRRSVWEEFGGFDTRYVPAYCEEADLCLGVASRGYKVYVNPLSVVTHLEGATMGTDERGPTLKAYQVSNAKKLHAKWHSVLSTAHNGNGDVTPFHTGRSNKNRFITVVFDHYIPEYDRDAGSRTMFAVCQALARIENNYVVFVPANNFRSRYASALERLGIEVVTGAEGWKRFDHLLANQVGVIRHAFVSRIEIARQYAWHLDQMKCAKSLYIHDIDTLRAFSYTPGAPGFENKTQVAIGEYITRNTDVFSKFQNIVSCSEDETSLLRPYLGDRVVNMFPYDIAPSTEKATGERGNDLVFVGSYNHVPNREGVEWFIRSVWPGARERLAGARLHIVGSGFENATFPDLDPRIVVHGQVTDQTLDYLYATCRVSIAPLLSGAGIKGKLIEACARGIPCVGTAAAWQGLDVPQGQEYLSGTNDSFGDRLVEAYQASSPAKAADLIAFYAKCESRAPIGKVIPSLVRSTQRKGRF